MFNYQAQQDQQQSRCPGCGRTSNTNVFIPDGAGISACPSCGLTAEEGQRKLNDELTAMFSRGMRLDGRDLPPAPIITSATLTAIGGGVLSAGATPTAAPSALGYNSSQHYHHSAHMLSSQAAAAAAGDALPRPNSAPGFVEGNAASGGGNDGAMDMDGAATAQHHDAEPYMKSGYEYLAERDYNRGGARDQADPQALSSKEWWRDFHQPIEFQYGVYQQMRDRQNEVPASMQEDEQMRLW